MADQQNLCPLCEQDNRCALSADRNAGNCWCQQQQFSQQLVKQANATSEQPRCICQRCAEQAQQLAHAIT
jgi:hypothetical protein